MTTEPLGIASALKARRESFAERHPALARFFVGRGPNYANAKTHAITVDCSTGARRVVAREIKVDPAYAKMPNIAHILIAHAAPKFSGPIAMPEVIRSKDGRGHPRPRLVHAYAEQVTQFVSEIWGVSARILLSPAKHRRAAYARNAACLLFLERNGVSYPDIGRFFKRDHTTVMHGIAVARRERAENPDYARAYAALLERVEKASTRQAA